MGIGAWLRAIVGSGCPTREHIRAAVAGREDRDVTRRIGRHAMGCARCATEWRRSWDRVHRARATDLVAPWDEDRRRP